MRDIGVLSWIFVFAITLGLCGVLASLSMAVMPCFGVCENPHMFSCAIAAVVTACFMILALKFFVDNLWVAELIHDIETAAPDAPKLTDEESKKLEKLWDVLDKLPSWQLPK